MNNIKCSKLNSCYYNDDCCLVMIPIQENEVIIGKEGIMYSNNENRYLEDPRRNKIKYSEIPSHYEKKSIFTSKKLFINQIFNYDTIYSIFKGNDVKNYYISKTDKGAILAIKNISLYNNKYTEIMNKDRLYSDLFSDSNIYILPGDGNVQKNIAIPDIDISISKGIEKIDSEIANPKRTFEYGGTMKTAVENDLHNVLFLLKRIEELRNLSDKPLSFDMPVCNDFIVVKTHNDIIEINAIKYHISINTKDTYKVSYTPISIKSDEFKTAIKECVDNSKKIKTIDEPVFDEKYNSASTHILKKSIK